MKSEKVIRKLRRIEGQVSGIQRMIAEERECEQVLTQIMAIKSALDGVTFDLIQSNLEACLTRDAPDVVRARMERTIQLLCKM
jgi:DNA-binding FrmR family transcriptional regulator